ncbi:hypothetical protein ACDQ55_19460 [Chitinophaga sp. 30R24]|uniref:hypothetical protein n=1 Tax=Chitinophaga sp. 30R24 TaxID=3248838 RepID=UPI003B8F698F
MLWRSNCTGRPHWPGHQKICTLRQTRTPEGRILATSGEAGFQAPTLAPGIYFWKWIWQYSITFQPFTIIPTGKIGLVLAKDGGELETGAILARKVTCDSFQDAVAFLQNGGRKGRQTAIITPGSYRINTFLFEVEATGDANSVCLQANAESDRMKLIAAGEAEKVRLLAKAEAERTEWTAKADAEKIALTGKAEAEKILAIGQSSAASYKLAVEAMGGDNFTQLKVMEAIGAQQIRIMPDVLINGGEGSNGPISGLLGLKLLEEIARKLLTNPRHKRAHARSSTDRHARRSQTRRNKRPKYIPCPCTHRCKKITDSQRRTTATYSCYR